MRDNAPGDIHRPDKGRAEWRPIAAAVLLGPRTRPLWITAAVGMVLFAAFRAVLILACWGDLAEVAGRGVLRCFLVGMKFDVMPIGFALLPMVLALSLAPDSALTGRRFRRLVAAYAAAMITLAGLVEVIGAGFFMHEGARLNWMSIGYLTLETAEFVWKNYPAWLVPPGIVAVYYLSYRLLRWAFWRGGRPAGPGWIRPVQTAVLVGLCALAAHGGVRGRPVRRGSANFSDNRLISQLTLNNFFTGFSAVRSCIQESEDELTLYSFPPPEPSARAVGAMLHQDQDTPLPGADNPLWRRTETGRPTRDYNVVMIVMESMAGRPVGALGHKPSYTPRLDAICEQGLFFERMYAVGARTNRGLVGSLCGHPDLGATSVLKSPRALGKFLTLPQVFRQRGYRTLMLYGGRAKFDNMGKFFTAGGVERIIEQRDLNAKALAGNWGVPDEVVFDRAHQEFEELGDQQFFGVILTVSNHEPYDIPAGRVPMLPADDERNRQLNAFRYADWAMGEFFRKARTSPYFGRTIFVLVADHGQGLNRRWALDVPGYRVPCVIYAPGIIPPARVRTVASQTDIPPTLLALMGGQYEHCFLGRNILAVRPGDGFALLHEDEYLGWVRGRRALLLRPGSDPMLFRVGDDSMAKIPLARAGPAEVADMRGRMLSYYRTALELFLNEGYRAPMTALAAAPR